jgi:hypothetical protein
MLGPIGHDASCDVIVADRSAGKRVNPDRIGRAFLGASALVSLAVIWPQLMRRQAKRNFGQLTLWDPKGSLWCFSTRRHPDSRRSGW